MIYLDNNATTPLAPEVQEAMAPYLDESGCFANPASAHSLGRRAMSAVETARSSLLSCLNARPDDRLVLLSGGTEANNLAVLGTALAGQGKPRQIAVSAIEHPSVLEPAGRLENVGFEVTELAVNRDGQVDLDRFEREIQRTPPLLVSVMHGNNETGVIQPVEVIAEMCREKGKGIVFHCDLCQSAGKIPVDLQELGCDLASFSAHKMYGPKGAGALYLREKAQVVPTILGGHQEDGLRAGTVNAPGVVGLASAFQLANRCMEEESSRLRELRDRFETLLDERLAIRVNGSASPRLPHVSNITLLDARGKGEKVLAEIMKRGICISTTSACQSKLWVASPVLKAMGVPLVEAQASFRASFGRSTTAGEIEAAVEIIVEVVRKHSVRRRLAPR